MDFKNTYKKGDQVYLIRSWNDKGTFYIRRATVQSWGKMRATLTLNQDGAFIKHFIYTQNVNKYMYGDFVFPATVDAQAVALDLARQYIEYRIDFLVKHRMNNERFHQPSIESEIETLKSTVPTCIAR